MQWLKTLLMRWLDIPKTVSVIRIKVDAEGDGDMTIESLTAMAGVFRNTPHLQASFMADFRDTMTALEKLPGDAQFERLRLAQKACDLWRCLSIPLNAVHAANALLEAQKAERKQEPEGPTGTRNVM